ncbi:DUF6907 domain-containing protein [Streptomyces caniscabiei]|uniref:Uncharacterized protein n=1 Tax=Streptomyces caniscabiei TaxID=2746961 RepID=A0ABU4N654_9ACTN|nr:hypothetical protein [Streptomyces caniscabiei]MBE4789934.1 hypothetical protein [Streptomyces caniscabiei]MBE4799726.1 hypothetical protein [Streptomyces caniscabiei]MDX2943324.1 hypothetical protein [Streptomyces caniscabiei]MDX3044549.1 hypothetical protein [Streptomyces caniscabiei]
MTEPRTITLPTEDHGPVTLPEPAWCRGHADHHPDSYLTDLTHFGPEHRLTFNGTELFRLMLAQTPYADRASRETCAYVEQSGYTGSLDPAGMYDLAAALDHAADRMREFADRLAVLLDGSSR